MTLVLTEISQFGIAMAADTAVTIQMPLPDGKNLIRVLTGVTKLQPIEKLQAGVSVWGQGQIGGIDSDVWLDRFIRTKQNECDSIDTFALLLRDQLRKIIPAMNPEETHSGTIGFHLAGFAEADGKKVPSFYHIHNGRSTALERRGISIDPSLINANHDLPPSEVTAFLEKGLAYATSNGDYRTYREMFGILENFLNDLANRTRGRVLIPISSCLNDRSEWLRFKIETMANIYRMSGVRFQGSDEYARLPTIGGAITTLTISTSGIERYETR